MIESYTSYLYRYLLFFLTHLKKKHFAILIFEKYIATGRFRLQNDPILR